MAELVSSIPLHGLDAVLVAVERALESGCPSVEQVMNFLGRLNEPDPPANVIATPPALREEPEAICRAMNGWYHDNGGQRCRVKSSAT
jgi:hypothetical protein